MKTKLVLLFVLFQTFSFFLSAKEITRTIPSMRTMPSKSFEEGTKVISAGIGFGGYSYYGYHKNKYSYRNGTPLFILTYEQPYKKPVGPGLLGVGFYLGFRNISSGEDHYINGTDYYSKHSWNHFLGAVRAAHLWDELTVEDAEIYVRSMIG